MRELFISALRALPADLPIWLDSLRSIMRGWGGVLDSFGRIPTEWVFRGSSGPPHGDQNQYDYGNDYTRRLPLTRERNEGGFLDTAMWSS